jgi:hypothetical protein
MLIVCTRGAHPTGTYQVGPHVPCAIWAIGALPFWTSWAQSPLSRFKLYKGRPNELGFHQAIAGHIVRMRLPSSTAPLGTSAGCPSHRRRPTPSSWTQHPRGPAWSRDSTTAAGVCPHPPRLLLTRDPPLALPHPSLRRTACQRVGSCTDSWLHRRASSSTGERAPPARRLLHRHTGSSTSMDFTGEWAPPPTRGFHHWIYIELDVARRIYR